MATILFVDDNRRIREFWQNELGRWGHQVRPAASGEEAVEAVRRSVPDLVILDVRLPGADGLTTFSRLQELKPELPVIFYTAHPGDLARDSRARCAVARVDKGTDPDDLKQVVAATLDRASKTAPGPLDRRAG